MLRDRHRTNQIRPPQFSVFKFQLKISSKLKNLKIILITEPIQYHTNDNNFSIHTQEQISSTREVESHYRSSNTKVVFE